MSSDYRRDPREQDECCSVRSETMRKKERVEKGGLQNSPPRGKEESG